MSSPQQTPGEHREENTMNTGGRLARGVASLLVLMVGLILAPVLLIIIATNRFGSPSPFAGASSWTLSVADVEAGLRQPLSDATVIDLVLRVSLTVAWLGIVMWLATVVAEVVHQLRHRGIPTPRVRGLSWSQPLARWIVAGLLVLPVMTNSSSRLTALDRLASDDDALVLDIGDPLEEATDESPTTLPVAVPAPEPVVHRVVLGESVFEIAAGLADGDAEQTIDIAHAILDENLGRPMGDGQTFSNPAYIEVGWELLIPPSVVRTGANGASRPGVTDGVTHIVVAGDSLSSIAKTTLGGSDEWVAIWEANSGRVMADGRAFQDPNLIVPGWELVIPNSGEPRVPDPIPERPRDNVPAPSTTPTPVPSAPVPESAPPALSSPATTPPTTHAAPTADPQLLDPQPLDPMPESVPDLSRTLGLEHAAVLSAGLLAVIGARRLRHLRSARAGVRVPPPAHEEVSIERRLRHGADVERALRLDVAVRAIAAHSLDRHDGACDIARIGLVTISTRGDLTAHLTSDLTLPRPWRGAASQWTLPATAPIESLAPDSRRVGNPCHALVTVGISDNGDEVLVDLETAGTLTVAAPPPLADDILRAIGVALATSERAEAAHLISVGQPCLQELSHPNTHLTETPDAACDLAMSLVGATMAQESTSYELRARRTGGDIWEPAVILVPDGQQWFQGSLPEPFTVPTHGIAVVHATTVQPTTTTHGMNTISCAEGKWQLAALEMTIPLTPIGIQPDDLCSIGSLLVDTTGVETDQHSTRRDDPKASDEFVEQAHQIIVGLFGGVTVVDRAGNPAKFSRSKSAELVTWLATHRDRSTRTAARTALWVQDVRDATFANVVSEARRTMARLAEPPSSEWLPRTLTEDLPLDLQVVSDAELIRARLDHARGCTDDATAVAVLRPVLDMIAGAPFAGTDYLWPDAEGITSNLVLLAVHACSEMAQRALALGDVELVFEATDRGLRVLPGHEEMIGLRMRAHATTEDLAGVRQEWDAYERAILADPWSDGEPAQKLCVLRAELLAPATVS